MERVRKRGFLFFVMVGVVVYVLLSAAIAVATVDKCGDESADKHWNFVPPSWECDAPNPFR
jgi:hypothetical protein